MIIKKLYANGALPRNEGVVWIDFIGRCLMLLP